MTEGTIPENMPEGQSLGQLAVYWAKRYQERHAQGTLEEQFAAVVAGQVIERIGPEATARELYLIVQEAYAGMDVQKQNLLHSLISPGAASDQGEAFYSLVYGPRSALKSFWSDLAKQEPSQ